MRGALATATLVNTFGNGALMTTFALYFIRVVAPRLTQVGLTLSAGALAGLLVQVPAGHLADLRGPRRVLQTLTSGAGVAMLGLLFARSVWALVAVMAVIALFDRGAQAVRNGYIARLAEGGQGVQFKAYLRAITNVGISCGALPGRFCGPTRAGPTLPCFAVNSATFGPHPRHPAVHRMGRPGWFVMGEVIALASLLMVPASSWDLRSRARYGVLTHSG